MRKNTSLVYSLVLMAGDFFSLLAAFTIAYIARVSVDTRPLIEQIPALEYIKLFALLLPFWLIIFYTLGLYHKHVYENRWRELWRLAMGSFVGMLFIIGYDYIQDPESTIFPARLVALYALLLGFSITTLMRQIIWQVKKLLYRYGIGVDKIMIIGSSPQTKTLTMMLRETATSGYEVVAIIGAKDMVPASFTGKHFSNIGTGLAQLETLGVDTIIQTKLYERDQTNEKIQAEALKHHLDYKLILTEHDYYSGQTRVELFQYFPVIAIAPTPLLGSGRILKRAMDLTLSALLILALLPVYMVIALFILLFDFGPIFFTQKRLTRWGRAVPILKFRTMKARYSGRNPVDVFTELGRPELVEEYTNNRAKVTNDPRVSALGRFLRRFSLDELPQLFNVLRGDISLVGPRTIPKDELERDFREKSPLILSVKTGITGLAQVSGRSDLSIEERIRLDQYYVQNWSLVMDFKILLKTIGTVLKGTDSK